MPQLEVKVIAGITTLIHESLPGLLALTYWGQMVQGGWVLFMRFGRAQYCLNFKHSLSRSSMYLLKQKYLCKTYSALFTYLR